MKKIIMLLFACSFIACAEKPLDVEEAKKVVEELITRTDKDDFDGIEKLYTADFIASERLDIKKEKLSRLKYTMGPVQSMEFVSATNSANFGEEQKVIVKYRVVHSRVNSIETFTLMKDEGSLKVGGHMVESEN